MGWVDRLGHRAIPKTGLGMAIINPTSGGKVKAATTSTTYNQPGQPLNFPNDNAQFGVTAYLGQVYVMRCVRLRADTIAGLPFRVGPDPDDPSVTADAAPLGRLLGPATPQEPGGPNPTTTARALWAWSIVQRVVTGRMGWEIQREADQADAPIQALWPLVSAALKPVPSVPGAPSWFDSFVYQTPMGDRPLNGYQVFYGWRPSVEDWRTPESGLESARMPIQVAMACDAYMWNLLRNGMVGSKLVIAPPFEDPADERAWEDQFYAEFCGFNNAGKVLYAYAENDYDTSGKLADAASVQVVDLSMKSIDAQLMDMFREAKNDICIALGVPRSLIGDASQRIYANADSEYRNFWTTTAIGDITELQDDVNLILAPQLGTDVGWFDLSRVAALQPPTIFQPPALKDAIDEGVVTADQAASLLGIPAASASGEDTSTAPIGEESATPGQPNTGSRSLRMFGAGSPRVEAPEGWLWKHRPVTSFTLRSGTAGWGLVRAPRVRITAAAVRAGSRRRPAPRPVLADELEATVAEVRARRDGDRSDIDRLGDMLTAALEEVA